MLTATALVALGALAVVDAARGAVWLQQGSLRRRVEAPGTSQNRLRVPRSFRTDGRTFMTADLDTRRARLRSDATLAARVVRHYPLEPLSPSIRWPGWSRCRSSRPSGVRPICTAAAGHSGEAAFRALHAAGGSPTTTWIRRCGGAIRTWSPGGSVAGRGHAEPGGICFAPICCSEQAHPGAGQRFRTRAEDRAPAVAAAVDAQTAKWCAAYFGDAAWPMPGREHGFFPAWRALARRTARCAARCVRICVVFPSGPTMRSWRRCHGSGSATTHGSDICRRT